MGTKDEKSEILFVLPSVDYYKNNELQTNSRHPKNIIEKRRHSSQ